MPLQPRSEQNESFCKRQEESQERPALAPKLPGTVEQEIRVLLLMKQLHMLLRNEHYP